MTSPYSTSNIAMNQGNNVTTTTDPIKQSKVYPNSLFRLLAPRKLITLSTCPDCADQIFKSQKTGGIIHDPASDTVTLTIKLCRSCVAENQSSSFAQLKLVKKSDQNVQV
uniref:Uncharacterized protein n=1 Tax=Panagrolaimus superbus TaxID=310955 RepID=A0A914XU66_9BILA